MACFPRGMFTGFLVVMLMIIMHGALPLGEKGLGGRDAFLEGEEAIVECYS